MTLDIREFHTHFIAIQDVPDHAAWKKYFVDAIDKELSDATKARSSDIDTWEVSHNSNTSYFDHYSSIDYDDFTKKVVTPILSEVFTELDFNPYPAKDVHYWYNRYDKMGHHDLHDHPESDICLIYLLHLEEENTTVFHNTKYTKRFMKTEITTEDLSEGKLIIFPNHLKHEVQWSENKRYTIAANILLNYDNES